MPGPGFDRIDLETVASSVQQQNINASEIADGCAIDVWQVNCLIPLTPRRFPYAICNCCHDLDEILLFSRFVLTESYLKVIVQRSN